MNEIERILAYHRIDSGRGAEAGERRKRVLVVEGDGYTRITLMNWLQASGFDVDFAPNGRLGLHQLGMWRPDALIMELNLRDLPGLEFIHRVRQDLRFKGRPIYVFTSTHFVKRGSRKDLALTGVKVFDKLSIAPEALVSRVAAELLGEKGRGLSSAAGNRPSSGTEWFGKGPARRRGERGLVVEEVPDSLSESMAEIWLRAKSLARSAGPMQRVAACAELRQEVYSLLSHAAVGGHRGAARQAKALVDFLDHLCEQSPHVSDDAMQTVAQSVEVLSGLAQETAAHPREAAKFKVVVVGETPASCESIQATLYEAGLEPVAFADPLQALDHLSAQPADLIITNLSAAGQESFDLAKIRALPFHQETPVMAAPEIAPESGDTSLVADLPVAELESPGHPGLLMQALNILQKSGAESAPADSSADGNQILTGERFDEGQNGQMVNREAETGAGGEAMPGDLAQNQVLSPVSSQLESASEPAALPVECGDGGDTAVWEQRSNGLRDVLVGIAQIQETCTAYVMAAGSPEQLEPLTGLYRQIRFFGASAGSCGFTKLAEIAGAAEALLFEIIFHKVQPVSSVLHSLVQAVDVLASLVETEDLAFPEPVCRPRVLVVDDDSVFTMTTIAALRAAQFDAVGAHDPDESLRLLESGEFGMLMLDDRMPGLDCAQFTESLRTMPQYASCPIIQFSEEGDAESQDQAVLPGINDLITKPASTAEVTLKATVNWVKSTPRSEASTDSLLNAGESQVLSAERGQAGVVWLGRGAASGPEPGVQEDLAPGGSPAVDSEREGEVQRTVRGEGAQDQGALSYADGSQDGIPLNYEAELAELRQARDENNARLAEEQRRAAELESRGQALEQALKERWEEQQRTAEAFEKQGRDHAQAQTALKRQLAESGARQNQLQDRCRQLEGELVDLRQIRDELKAKAAGERERAGEWEKRTRDLEAQLKDRLAQLEKAKAEAEKQAEDRALAEAEMRRELAENGARQNQLQARCQQMEGELADLRRTRDDLSAKIAGEAELAGEWEKRSKGLEAQLRDRSVQLEHARAEADKLTEEQAHAEAEMRRQLAESSGRQIQLQGRCQQMEGELADLRKNREELQGLLDANLDKFTALASELREKLLLLKSGAEPTSSSKPQPETL